MTERTLDSKLEVFDQYAPAAVAALIRELQEHPDEYIAIARGRHVEGHMRYGDVGVFNHDTRGLLAESAQELGDAIVYTARRLHLQAGGT